MPLQAEPTARRPLCLHHPKSVISEALVKILIFTNN